MTNDDIPLEDDINIGMYGLIRKYDKFISSELKKFEKDVEYFSKIVFSEMDQEIEEMKKCLIYRQGTLESTLVFYNRLIENQENDRFVKYHSYFNLAQSKLLGIELMKEENDKEYVKTFDIRYNFDSNFRKKFDQNNLFYYIPEFDENDPSYV